MLGFSNVKTIFHSHLDVIGAIFNSNVLCKVKFEFMEILQKKIKSKIFTSHLTFPTHPFLINDPVGYSALDSDIILRLIF